MGGTMTKHKSRCKTCNKLLSLIRPLGTALRINIGQ